MKKETLKAYGTEIDIYESIRAEDEEFVQGITDDHERIVILHGGEFTNVPRNKGSYYIVGNVHDREHMRGITKSFLFTAEGIDLKQAANLLIGLGADQGVAIPCDLNEVYIIEDKQEKTEKKEEYNKAIADIQETIAQVAKKPAARQKNRRKPQQ